MKNKKTKIIAIIGVCILLGSGILGAIANMGGFSSLKSSGDTVGKGMSESEQDVFVEELATMNEYSFYPADLESRVKPQIKSLNKDNSTKAIRELVRSMQDVSDYYTQLLYFMGPEIEHTKGIDGIENPFDDRDKISNKFVNGYFEEILRQHLIVKPTDGSMYIEPDVNYVLEEYGDYTHGDYKDYLNIVAKQQTEAIFDEVKEMYVVERIMEDIQTIDNSRDRWEEGPFAEDFLEIEQRMYEILFSVSHGTFFDESLSEDTEELPTYTFKKEVREKLESFILNNKDAELTKEIEAYLKVLKEENFELNEKVESYLSNMMEDKFAVNIEMPDESEENLNE